MIEATVAWRKHKLVFQHEKADHIARYHQAGVLYEKALIDFVLKLKQERAHKRAPGVFLDVGAHVGNHAVAWAKSGLFSCGVAFESNVDTFQHLQTNVVRNGVHGLEDGIWCLPFHVGARTAEVRCDGLDPAPDNTGMRSIREHRDGTRTVQVFALDDFETLSDIPAPPKGRVALVKIDVEGAEMAVLQGARKLLRTYRPIVVMESTWTRAAMLAELPPDYRYVGTFNRTPTHVFVGS